MSVTYTEAVPAALRDGVAEFGMLSIDQCPPYELRSTFIIIVLKVITLPLMEAMLLSPTSVLEAKFELLSLYRNTWRIDPSESTSK